MEPNWRRIGRLVSESVEDFALDLSGLEIFTEAATGAYASTAVLAAAAGAERVYAICRSSPHGSAARAREETEKLRHEVGAPAVVEYVEDKRETELSRADIVTNSGFVRPINERMISWLKGTAVVPLMFEPWEFRESDVDLEACWEAGIPVVGTDESDPRVQTQAYVGPLVVELALEQDIEVLGSEAMVVGGGEMAGAAVQGLEALGANVYSVARNPRADAVQRRLLGNRLDDSEVLPVLEHLDVVAFVEHRDQDQILGPDGQVTGHELADRSPSVALVHVCGNVDFSGLEGTPVRHVPDTPAPPGRMSFTTGYVGPRPVVTLQSAGLAVGNLVVRKRREGHVPHDAVEQVRDNPLVADFDEAFKTAHGYGRLLRQDTNRS